MYVDPRSTVAGLPALTTRAFLRHAGDTLWTVGYLTEVAKVTIAKARRVTRDLVALGYVVPLPERKHARTYYRRTLKGSAFSLASAARPITRETAERSVAAFVERVHT